MTMASNSGRGPNLQRSASKALLHEVPEAMMPPTLRPKVGLTGLTALSTWPGVVEIAGR
ncbi:hypothetical protein FAGKG844_300020 [Frankia sp. AgKG'84/4]